MPQTERRRQPRIEVDLPLTLTIQNRTVETRIRDLSTTGIRFHTPQALPLLSRVQIGLELPEASGRAGGGASISAIAITGVIVRSEAHAEGGSYDTAIYFEDLSEGARTQLTRFVSAQTE